jgi:hypothetical protein
MLVAVRGDAEPIAACDDIAVERGKMPPGRDDLDEALELGVVPIGDIASPADMRHDEMGVRRMAISVPQLTHRPAAELDLQRLISSAIFPAAPASRSMRAANRSPLTTFSFPTQAGPGLYCGYSDASRRSATLRRAPWQGRSRDGGVSLRPRRCASATRLLADLHVPAHDTVGTNSPSYNAAFALDVGGIRMRRLAQPILEIGRRHRAGRLRGDPRGPAIGGAKMRRRVER